MCLFSVWAKRIFFIINAKNSKWPQNWDFTTVIAKAQKHFFPSVWKAIALVCVKITFSLSLKKIPILSLGSDLQPFGLRHITKF